MLHAVLLNLTVFSLPPSISLCYSIKIMFKSKAKIVGTLGPNSDSVKTIEKMINAGLSVARINMSHGNHEEHAAKIKNACTASRKARHPLAILQDLAGPKIRIGDFETETVTLKNGKKLILTTKKHAGTEEKVHVNYARLPKEVAKGMTIFLNDGKQKLVVEKVTSDEIHTKIVVGGTIRGRRGVNIPDADLSISSLTPKDKEDLKFGIEQGVTFMTLSFVCDPKDIKLLRKLIGDNDISIVAKIETKAAIENLEEIVELSDVIMVARGDLATEMPPETVPMLQKKIIRTANLHGKPVITATQMLDSMRLSTTPTRAEVADIANAILDGTDAIMLSDETAIGEYPVKAVEVMTKVAHEVETDEYLKLIHKKWNFSPKANCEAVGRSIVHSARHTDAVAIAAYSESGYTGRMVSRYRPYIPVLVLTPYEKTQLKMQVVYGCEPIVVRNVTRVRDAVKLAAQMVRKKKLGTKGDTFIMGAGIPFGEPGATNMMLIETLK